jgi:hypothetical protein
VLKIVLFFARSYSTQSHDMIQSSAPHDYTFFSSCVHTLANQTHQFLQHQSCEFHPRVQHLVNHSCPTILSLEAELVTGQTWILFRS